MYNTIIQQGNFVSTGANVTLQLRNGVDWIQVYNYTQIAANSASTGYQFYWQAGMPQGGGLEYQSNSGSSAINLLSLASGGFTFIDTTSNPVSAGGTITSISGAGGVGGVPRLLVASTAGLTSGDIILINNVTGGQQLGGYYFEVTVVDGTHLDLIGMPSIANATAGTYQVINFPPNFQPALSTISKVSSDSPPLGNSTIQTTAPHGYKVGQLVRFSIPAAFGMPQLNGLVGTVTSVVTQLEFDTDINITGFTAFTFPVTTATPFTPALAVPFGQVTDIADLTPFNLNFGNVNSFDDSVTNQAFIGITLDGGTADSPAGVDSDLVYWIAGTSFNVDNV